MKITDLTPEMAQCASEEFLDSWLSRWAAARQQQDVPQTGYAYGKGYMANAVEEGDKR